VQFTSEKAKMGVFTNPTWMKILAWSVAVLIAVLNIYLLIQTLTGT
jgi:manganese transport protein